MPRKCCLRPMMTMSTALDTIGTGVWGHSVPEPTLNPTLSGKQLANIYYGLDHAIGLTTDGRVYAWGGNGFGQLANGSIECSNTRKVVNNLPKIIDICCGSYHRLALISLILIYIYIKINSVRENRFNC